MLSIANISEQFSFVKIFFRIHGAFYYFSPVNENRELFENVRVAFPPRENDAGVPQSPALPEFTSYVWQSPAEAVGFW